MRLVGFTVSPIKATSQLSSGLQVKKFQVPEGSPSIDGLGSKELSDVSLSSKSDSSLLRLLLIDSNVLFNRFNSSTSDVSLR